MDARAMAPPNALIVENEAVLSMDMEDLLVAEGFAPVVASTWAEAVRVLPDSLVVAIISIVLADDIVGQRVIQSLRRVFPNLPIVVVTGHGPTAPEADLRGLGGPTIRLRKPAMRSELAAAIWDVIGHEGSGAAPVSGRRRDD